MRPISVTLAPSAAPAYTALIPLNRLQRAFVVALAVELNSVASLTYTVQHTLADPSDAAYHPISISRSTTTATVTDPAHGLVTGDAVWIQGSGSSVLDGYQAAVTVTGVNTYTYTCANSGPTADGGFAQGKNFHMFPHDVLVGLTVSQASNYVAPPSACRLYISIWSAGTATLRINQGR